MPGFLKHDQVVTGVPTHLLNLHLEKANPGEVPFYNNIIKKNVLLSLGLTNESKCLHSIPTVVNSVWYEVKFSHTEETVMCSQMLPVFIPTQSTVEHQTCVSTCLTEFRRNLNTRTTWVQVGLFLLDVSFRFPSTYLEDCLKLI